ncbi:SusC/RagA family TonB-linked outer membrane protein [Polaribacter cellanae]|uniref:SusC/RagA family TonB-linked outer membrane protein n=1 Tax=Polaribacter cellanae TaxID=2818493 RepID=A0A975CRL0_9FLAO|nr:SusC/RagA family TonB-linked outer membrane protein [Polaribacter cellanae]QTE23977.1 SusC/RagA family TonB-linked outer membrane protein [Polaribacter cellanae]
MKTKFKGILTLLLAFVVQISFAQQKTVSGTVSEESGVLPGVSIVIKGTNKGTETNFDGKYSIKANSGDVLVFRYLGYKTTEKTVENSSVINVTMKEDANVLEEIVVVGYGTTTKKAYAGTATTISVENLEAKTFSNVSQALTGEVAGVTVINSSGQPGSVGTIRIRGYGSPNGNRTPLYVVDGVPFYGGSADTDTTDNNDAATNGLASINPSDILSTTILKDATATAIYGSRGANGVVLITTKKGRTGESYIEVDVKTSINSQVIKRYDVISSPEQYVGLVWEGLYNQGVTKGNANPIAFANARVLGKEGIGAGYNMWDATTGAALINPDTRTVRKNVKRLFTPEKFSDLAFGNGIRTEANLKMGGGSEKTRYFASIGYLKDNGYIINSDFKRYTTRLNINSKVKDWLDVSANIGYSFSITNNNGQTEGSENLFEFADKTAPIYPVFARYPNSAEKIPDLVYGGFQYDYGSATGTLNGFTRPRPQSNLLNPIGSATLDHLSNQNHGLNGSFTANFKLSDKLTFETRYGAQYGVTRRVDVLNHVYGTGSGPKGTITRTDFESWNYSFLQLLRYKNTFGDHELELLAAHESNERSEGFSREYKQNVFQPGVYTLSNYAEATRPSIGTTNASGIESYFSQINYNYNGKYYLTGSLRTDGSSRFVNNKWGTFGSIGAAWILSEEDFMADSFVSFLKAKVSYGVLGDQEGVSTSSGFTIYGREFVGGSLSIPETRPGNPDLTWETSKMFQAGIEMSLGNYLDMNLDYYRKNTDNLFFDQTRGPSAGFSSILVNDGEALNSGLEFDLTGHIINTNDFKLSLSLNGEVLENKMLAMPLDVSTGKQKVIDLNGYYAYAVDRSFYDFYMREWAGVDPTDGAPTWNQYYDDKNNNGIVDKGETGFSIDDGNGGNANGTGSLFEYRKKVPDANIKKTVTKSYSSATEVFLEKNLIPKLRGAFRLSGKIKSFDFSTQFLYSLGGYAYDAQYGELLSDRFGAAGNNFHKDILKRWQKPGDITNVPLLSNNEVKNGTSTSSRFITSTDFLALNNARVGYTLPSNFLSNKGIDAVNLWVSGDNLFIKSARQGFNPSLRENGNSARRIYAPATTITLGVRVKF